MGAVQTTFQNAPMKMQFGDVTQPPNTQAKFGRLSAMLLLAWQPCPNVSWAGRGWGRACEQAAGAFWEGLLSAHVVSADLLLIAGQDLDENYHI